MHREAQKTGSGKEEVLAGDESGREGGLRMLLAGVWGTAGGSFEHGVVGTESYADMFLPAVVWSLCCGEEKPRLVESSEGAQRPGPERPWGGKTRLDRDPSFRESPQEPKMRQLCSRRAREGSVRSHKDLAGAAGQRCYVSWNRGVWGQSLGGVCREKERAMGGCAPPRRADEVSMQEPCAGSWKPESGVRDGGQSFPSSCRKMPSGI